MKNLMLTVLLAATVSAAFAATERKISSLILDNFKVDFKDAVNVNWSSKTEYAKASFILNHQQMEAFYSLNGDVVAVSKNIALEELPLNTKRALAKRFEGYIIKEAVKFDQTDESSYYISIENEKEALILKVNENQDLSLFQRTKKVTG